MQHNWWPILWWVVLHLVAVMVRLPFSEEKVGRLKMSAIGLAFTAALVATIMTLVWMENVGFESQLNIWIQSLSSPAMRSLAELFMLLGAGVLVFAVLSMFFGHTQMWFAWIVSDIEVMD